MTIFCQMQSLAGLLRRKPPDAPPRGAAAYDSAYDSAQNIGRIVNVKIHPRKCDQNCQRKRCLPNFPFTRKIECGHRRKRCRRVSRRKRIPGRPWNQQVDRSIHVAWSWPYKNIFQNNVAQNRIQNHGHHYHQADLSCFGNQNQNQRKHYPCYRKISKACDKSHRLV